jgi:hypothetical protein
MLPGTESTFSRYWQLVQNGIYFASGAGDATLLKHLDLSSNRIHSIAKLGSGLVIGPRGLSVSSDSQYFLFTREDLSFSDISLIENLN